MESLQTSYMGLTLKNPLIASSSGLTSNVESIKKLAQNGIGAVVLKSLFEEQINYETGRLESFGMDHPDAVSYLSAYAKSNSLESYLTLIKMAKQAVDIPIIASILCITVADWIDFAENIERTGADALELNLFFLPTDKNRPSASYEEVYADLISTIKSKVKIPVAVKLGYYFTNPLGMVQQLYFHKADAVVMFNRFYEPDIDIDNLTMKPGEVFSHPSDLRQSLRWISLISSQLPKVALSASTGAHDGAAVVKLLLAGASTVQVCSTLYKNGLGRIDDMLQFLQSWMKQHNFRSIDEFRGHMNYQRIPDPEIYERSQFMKYYSSRE